DVRRKGRAFHDEILTANIDIDIRHVTGSVRLTKCRGKARYSLHNSRSLVDRGQAAKLLELGCVMAVRFIEVTSAEICRKSDTGELILVRMVEDSRPVELALVSGRNRRGIG